MSGYNVVVEADNDLDDGLAREIAGYLCEAYPGHPWHVRVAQNMLIVKHMKLSSKAGMVRRLNRLTWDARVRKHEVVMAAGEFLERAGLTRGKVVEGEVVGKVEGLRDKDLLPGRVMQ